MTADSLIDIHQDDTGYSEPYTFFDFCKEMYECTLGFSNKFEIFWNTLKRESQPYEPTRRMNLGTDIEDPYGDFRRSEILEYNNR